MTAPDRTPQRVVEEARKLLGIGENPPGSNCNVITARFGQGCCAWCDETWWTALYNAGFNDGSHIAMPGVHTDYSLGDTYVPSTMRHFQAAGRFSRTPVPGAGEVHFWGGPESNSHIATYVSDYGDGTHLNIEGNHNNVCEYVRRRNDDPTIKGYCIPVYVAEEDDVALAPDEHTALLQLAQIALNEEGFFGKFDQLLTDISNKLDKVISNTNR